MTKVSFHVGDEDEEFDLHDEELNTLEGVKNIVNGMLKKEKEKEETCNGWANYETWNVGLWIQNTEEIYYIAKQFDNYKDFVNLGIKSQELFYNSTIKDRTGDDVLFDDKKLNIEELDNMIKELS